MSQYIYKHCWVLVIFSAVAFLVVGAPAARANTFTVNSTADVVDVNRGDGKCETGRDAPGVTPPVKECTLRAAVQESNSLAGQHEITLPGGTYLLSLPTSCSFRIREVTGTLTQTSVSLCMTGQLTINGAGANTTVIDGGGQHRVIFVDSFAAVELRGVTIQKGLIQQTEFALGGGGGIHNRGTLTLTETVVSGNTSNFGGGGINNVGTLRLSRSTLLGNTAVLNSGFGGGIFNGGASGSSFCDVNPCDVTVDESLITANGSILGGGIGYWDGTVRVTGSTISDNTSGNGGGVCNLSGKLWLNNSTLSGNTADIGGGLSVAQQGPVPQAALNNVTITRNKGRQSGGGLRTTANITSKNTLIAGNTNGDFTTSPDCETHFSAIVSGGYNLIQDVRGCTVTGDTAGNITGKDPLLGSLADNGGLTPTHAPLPDSPALNAGNPKAPGSGGAACTAADQRGRLRPFGSRCDIGAFEREGGLSVSKVTPSRGGNTGSVTAAISGSGFGEGAKVSLRRAGQPDIAGASAAVEAAGFAIFTSLDLTGRPAGTWDVVVSNPDGTSKTLPGGFTIEDTSSPDLWSSVVGRSAVRVGVPAQYAVLYGNRGNVDAFNVPLTLSVPANAKLFVYFDIAPPPARAVQAATDWSRVPVVVLPNDVRTDVPLVIPVIPAGFTGSLRFSILIPPDSQHGSEFFISAFLGKPYFKPGLDEEVLGGFVSGARAYAQRVLGVAIPTSLDTELRQYITEQLQSAAATGRQSLLDSLGAGTEVYSLAHLTIDLARFGAARAAGSLTSQGPAQADLSRTLYGSSALAAAAPDAMAAGGGQGGCGGRILQPGTTCSDNPTPIPTPEKPPKDPGVTPGECRDIPNHIVSADGTQCIPKDRKACPNLLSSPFFTDPDCRPIPIKSSVDPNDKAGAPGVNEGRFQRSATPLAYTVFFENLPTATAAAQTVTVTDQLDVASLDLDTFNLGPVSFGPYTVTPPAGQSEFVSALDLRPANDLIVKIDARLDRVTGVVTWQFTSLDPATQQLTEDPLAGFLPPNTGPPAGEGKVLFSVRPKKGLAAGTKICNKASIVFDVNAPIETPQWCNTFDDDGPVSKVQPLAPAQTETNFLVRWSGSDAGSGVGDYTVYVSDDGGPFIPWVTQTAATEAIFAGAVGHSYSFFSVARDLTGNAEAVKAAGEAVTYVTAPSCPNPIDCTDFFVRQHYRDFLNREPDASGLQFWSNEIEGCGADAQCREVKRVNVSAAFFLSIEFQQTGYLAYRAHKAAFGNITAKPVPVTRAEMLAGMQVIGNGVIVNSDGWEQKLEQNKRDYFDQLASSQRFTDLYPQALTPEQFVDALNTNAGGALTQAEGDALVSDLKGGVKTRAQALRAVAEDADLTRAEFNKAFVLMQYFGYLRRDPDSPPDSDFTGYNFWLGKLNEFNGNFIQAEMVKAFLDSFEYRKRFGQ